MFGRLRVSMLAKHASCEQRAIARLPFACHTSWMFAQHFRYRNNTHSDALDTNTHVARLCMRACVSNEATAMKRLEGAVIMQCTWISELPRIIFFPLPHPSDGSIEPWIQSQTLWLWKNNNAVDWHRWIFFLSAENVYKWFNCSMIHIRSTQSSVDCVHGLQCSKPPIASSSFISIN